MSLLLVMLLAVAPPTERWVDAAAGPGGDGSRAHPFHSIAEALGPNVNVHLAQGRYPGPLSLPDRSALLAKGQATIAGEVRVSGTVVLEGLTIEGGAVGLRAENAKLTLRNVQLTGQSDTALRVEGGQLVALDVKVSGEGRGLDASSAHLDARALNARTSRGSRIVQSSSRILGSSFAANPGVALMVAGGQTRFERVKFEGGSDGLLTGDHAQLELVDVTARGSQSAIAIVESSARFTKVVASSSGGEGARWVNSSVQGSFQVSAARGCGVLVKGGEVTLDALKVTQARSSSADEGCAINARNAKLSIGTIEASNLSGTAIWIAQLATLRFERARVHDVGQSALIVETGAQVTGGWLEADRTGEAAVTVSGPAQLELGHLTTTSTPPLATTCDARTQVKIAFGLPKPVSAYCQSELQ